MQNHILLFDIVVRFQAFFFLSYTLYRLFLIEGPVTNLSKSSLEFAKRQVVLFKKYMAFRSALPLIWAALLFDLVRLSMQLSITFQQWQQILSISSGLIWVLFSYTLFRTFPFRNVSIIGDNLGKRIKSSNRFILFLGVFVTLTLVISTGYLFSNNSTFIGSATGTTTGVPSFYVIFYITTLSLIALLMIKFFKDHFTT